MKLSLLLVLAITLMCSLTTATDHEQCPAFSTTEHLAVNDSPIVVNDSAIYRVGWYSAAGSAAWQPFHLEGVFYADSVDWLSGTATATFPPFGPGQYYAIIYSSNNPVTWDSHGNAISPSGCWQLHVINNSVVEEADYYVAPWGDDANQGTFEEPFLTINYAESQMKGGDKLYVRGGTYNEKVILYEIDGTAENPTMILAYPGETPIIDGTGIKMGLGSYLTVMYSDYTHFIGFEIRNVNINGLPGSHGSGIGMVGDHSLVANCTVHNIWGRGIGVSGSHCIVEYCTVYNACLSNADGVFTPGEVWAAGISAMRHPDYVVLRNNIVHDIWGEGMSTFETTHVVIEDNIIYDIYSVGLYLSDTTNSIAQRNIIYLTKAMGEGKPVGLGHWNETNNPSNANNTIINNMVYGYYRNFYTGPMIGTFVAHNVFMNSRYFAGVQLGIGNNATFANNIVIQEDSIQPIYSRENEDITYQNNLYNKEYDVHAIGLGDIIGDPKLTKLGSVEAGRLSGEYFKLLADSPAIDAGTVLSGVRDDYFSNFRDSNPDIGAVESSGAARPNYFTELIAQIDTLISRIKSLEAENQNLRDQVQALEENPNNISKSLYNVTL